MWRRDRQTEDRRAIAYSVLSIPGICYMLLWAKKNHKTGKNVFILSSRKIKLKCRKHVHFCQMSPKLILIISSYTVSKLVHFLRHSVAVLSIKQCGHKQQTNTQTNKSPKVYILGRYTRTLSSRISETWETTGLSRRRAMKSLFNRPTTTIQPIV